MLRNAKRPVSSILAAILCIFCPALASAQFSVRPVHLEIVPGKTAEMTVTNDGNVPLNLRLVLNDFEQDTTGQHIFSPPGRRSSSCSDYLQFQPSQIHLEAGMSGTVRVTVRADAPICWSVLWARKDAERRPGLQTGASISLQIGTKIYAIADSVTSTAELRSASVVRDSTGSAKLRVVLENTGRRVLRPEGYVDLRDGGGRRVTHEKVNTFSILPGHRRVVLLPIPKTTAPGRYFLMPMFDYSGDDVLAARVPLVVK